MDAKKKKSSIGLCAVMVLLGLFYILNAGNFGKTLPAYWGFVAVPLGLAALFPAWRGARSRSSPVSR